MPDANHLVIAVSLNEPIKKKNGCQCGHPLKDNGWREKFRGIFKQQVGQSRDSQRERLASEILRTFRAARQSAQREQSASYILEYLDRNMDLDIKSCSPDGLGAF